MGNTVGALSFDGDDDYINAGTNSVLLPDVFSVSAWVKHSGAPSSAAIINFTTGLTSSYPVLKLMHGTNFRPIIYLGANNHRYFSTSSPTEIFDDNWHHLTFVVTGNEQSDINNAQMYVDGIAQDVVGTTSSGPPATKTGFIIGRDYGRRVQRYD